MSSVSTEISALAETLCEFSREKTVADLTSNRAPFSDDVFPQLAQLVDKITTLDNLRTSKDVIKLLQKIIDQCVASILVKCWRVQSMKPRLDAMMKLAVPFLCTPLMTSMLNIGESLTQSTCTLDRIKKCIVDIFTFFIKYELSLLRNGEVICTDVDRVDLCISLLGSKCSKYSPLAVTLREHAFPLLRGLSLHALGVTALCEDVCEAISVLVHHLGLQVLGGSARRTPVTPASAHSAFSTDVIEIQRRVLEGLHPAIADYFSWLLQHREPLVKTCRSREVVEGIHPALRRSLQHEEFSSPADIISKYERKYRRHLTLMPLPVQLFQRDDILQAAKDIEREDFILNGVNCHGSALISDMLTCLTDAFSRLESRGECCRVLEASEGGGARDERHVPDSLPGTGQCAMHGRPLDGPTEAPCSSPSAPSCRSGGSRNDEVLPLAEFIELLSRFLLIAASRTLSSGDAFFVLSDLFGGEGLTLAPRSRECHAEQEVIKVDISPLQILVECSQCYDLFSTAQISQCRDRKVLAPIISFEIKVFSVFKFTNMLLDFVNMSPSSNVSTSSCTYGHDPHFQNSLFSYLFILLSSDPERVCRRSLTIVPTAAFVS